MKKKTQAKTSEEFDRRFDSGEDIHDLIDMPKATLVRHGKKVRITLDIAESLVKDILPSIPLFYYLRSSV